MIWNLTSSFRWSPPRRRHRPRKRAANRQEIGISDTKSKVDRDRRSLPQKSNGYQASQKKNLSKTWHGPLSNAQIADSLLAPTPRLGGLAKHTHHRGPTDGWLGRPSVSHHLTTSLNHSAKSGKIARFTEVLTGEQRRLWVSKARRAAWAAKERVEESIYVYAT